MDPQQIMARLKVLLSSFQPAQLASLVLAFVVVVGMIVGAAWWANKPTYALLISDMDPETAGEIVTRLKTLKVSYQLDPGGRAIRVPAARVDELRLELTAQGLPGSGRVGFELFDRTAFGATEFLEQVNYRRALEGEIGRTIATLTEVATARVHITMGKDALFGDSRPAKASVVLKLRGQRTLPAAAISGITNLVAASVEGLRPEAVVILDSLGRPLARITADDGEQGGAGQIERQQRLERELSTRVVALLEPVIGAERVRVSVALKLNPSTVEQTEEHFDPMTVVRSKQVAADSTSSTNPGLGLAGVRGNAVPPAPDPKNPTPPAATAQASAGGSGATRNMETTNYDVSRTMVVTQKPPGEIARLSVAVMVDDDQVVQKGTDGKVTVTHTARSAEELQKIQGIVSTAVGFEVARGDQITVQNMSFEEITVEEAEPLTTFQQLRQYGPQIWDAVRMLLLALVAVLVMFFFVRPLMQRVKGGGGVGRVAQNAVVSVAGATQPVRTVAEMENELEAQLDASGGQRLDSRRLPVLTRRVSAISAKEPENVAKLMRSWINDGER